MHNLDETEIFEIWFVLNETRIRQMRDEYEIKNKTEISLREYAMYINFTENPLDNLNQN